MKRRRALNDVLARRENLQVTSMAVRNQSPALPPARWWRRVARPHPARLEIPGCSRIIPAFVAQQRVAFLQEQEISLRQRTIQRTMPQPGDVVDSISAIAHEQD